jgi:hypothetical protein
MGDDKPAARSGGLFSSLSRLALGGGSPGPAAGSATAARTPSSDTLRPDEDVPAEEKTNDDVGASTLGCRRRCHWLTVGVRVCGGRGGTGQL